MTVLSTLKRYKSIIGFPLGALILVLIIIKLKKSKRKAITLSQSNLYKMLTQQTKIGVDSDFLTNIWSLLKLTFCKNGIPLNFILFNFLLVFRSILTIRLSMIKGKIVKSIVSSDPRHFFNSIVDLGLMAIPGSIINSWLEYLEKMISLKLRTGLVHSLNSKYLHGKVYYQMMNVDSRINCPDQTLTDDIMKWSCTLSELYCDFSKPVLDIILFSRKIASVTSFKGPFLMIFWYIFTGWLIKTLSPAFSKIIAEIMKREGVFRANHQRIKQHSEEIAFLRGEESEKKAINQKFSNLMKLYKYENKLRFFMGILDGTLIKYGAYNVGMAILGLPVFGPDKLAYLARVSSDPSLIMKDYEQNSTLLVNLARAIGKIVISYKKLQQLAGSTSRVSQFVAVLDDLTLNGKYERNIVANRDLIWDENLHGCALTNKKVWKANDFIKFEEVPIIAPNGELLLHNLSIKIKSGKSCLIVGANGTGKTALLRVLAGLWPFFSGKISKIPDESILYLPQKVYLPKSKLRELIIYPHLKPLKSDLELLKILENVKLEYLYNREGGFEAMNDWYDILSGGERQRISVARLFYHVPQFAVLDEATSAVSVEIENTLYKTAKQLGITLITVTQRKTLDQFHDYILRIKDNCDWDFEEIRNEHEQTG